MKRLCALVIILAVFTLFFGCGGGDGGGGSSSPTSPSSVNQLVGTWNLTAVNGSSLPPGASATVTLTDTTWGVTGTVILSTTGILIGATCTESGTYSISGNTVTTTTRSSTCDPSDVNTTETATYSISGNTLTITWQDGTETYTRV